MLQHTRPVFAMTAVLDCNFELVYPLIWKPLQPEICVQENFPNEVAPLLSAFQAILTDFVTIGRIASFKVLDYCPV